MEFPFRGDSDKDGEGVPIMTLYCHYKVILLAIDYQKNKIDGIAMSGFGLMSRPTCKI